MHSGGYRQFQVRLLRLECLRELRLLLELKENDSIGDDDDDYDERNRQFECCWVKNKIKHFSFLFLLLLCNKKRKKHVHKEGRERRFFSS